MLVVLTTTPGFSEGSELAEKLVEAKLAACVQVVPQITSVYAWEGKLQKENEQLLLIKAGYRCGFAYQRIKHVTRDDEFRLLGSVLIEV